MGQHLKPVKKKKDEWGDFLLEKADNSAYFAK